MAFRDIIVFLNRSASNHARLSLAVNLARNHDAHLFGIDVSQRSSVNRDLSNKTTLSDIFSDLTSEAGIHAAYEAIDPKQGDWKDWYSHYADLIITTSGSLKGDDAIPAQLTDTVLTTAGVPCLLLPAGWQGPSVGRNVVIAWSASREATRAVHDAMPILKTADHVTLFTHGPRSDGRHSDPELMRAHLSRHGVPVEVVTWQETGDMSPTEALFASLGTQDADLVVAGAFGRSRFSASLFGGFTSDLLREPVLPLLLSH